MIKVPEFEFLTSLCHQGAIFMIAIPTFKPTIAEIEMYSFDILQRFQFPFFYDTSNQY